jgi:chemotaxis protein MotB
MADGPKVIVIKKKGKGHGHHGGAWKVAYADFVTAMMALFIVLWLLTQSDQASKEVIAEYFRTGTMPGGSLTIGRPAGSNPPVPVDILPQGSSGGLSMRALNKLANSMEKLLKKAASSGDAQMAKLAKSVTVKVSAQGALIELVDSGEDLLFAVSSSELKPATVRFLEQIAPLLTESGQRIEIHGHTDARAFDKTAKKTNWDLSYERAERARKILEAKGVPHGEIDGVLAHADTQLYVADKPLAPQNRRLSILVKPTGGEPPVEIKREGLHEQPEEKEADKPAEGASGNNSVLEPGSLKREAERQRHELEQLRDAASKREPKQKEH